MYSGTSVGPRTEPCGTPALTEYFCEEFPSRTTRNCLLLRKEETSLRLKFKKKKSMPNPVKSLRYMKCYSPRSPRTIKRPSNLSDTIAKRSKVDREDLKPYWKSEKRPYFSRRSTILLFTSFSATLLTTQRLTGHSF